MNIRYRNAYIAVLLVTVVAVLIAFGLVLYDVYKVLMAMIEPSFQLTLENFYKIMSETIIFQISFFVILLNTLATYLKSRIAPEFKHAFAPNFSIILIYIFGMTAIHISGYLTVDYYFLSLSILMIFAIVTFNKWSTELRLIQELNKKNLSIFKDDEVKERKVQAEEKPIINPKVKFQNNEIDVGELFEKVRKDRKYLLSQPINFLKIDPIYSLIVYIAQDEKLRKKMKNLSRLGLFLRCIFLTQVVAVVMYAFKENNSLEFMIGNLTAPLFWLMATLTVELHYHSTMMIFVSQKKYKKLIQLRKGLIYIALFGTLICSMSQPKLSLFLISLFYFLSAYWVVKTAKKPFSTELNTITEGLLTGTTTAEK